MYDQKVLFNQKNTTSSKHWKEDSKEKKYLWAWFSATHQRREPLESKENYEQYKKIPKESWGRRYRENQEKAFRYSLYLIDY